jgi:tripartite-type tricarboxylate transporter receptor subunit TctC
MKLLSLQQSLRVLALGILALVSFATAQAEPYPSKPIKVVVPYPPGGVVDIIARAIGNPMSQSIGQPIVVENRTGAASNIGTDAVARSEPDGYTLVLASPAHTVNVSLYPKLTWHPLTSFAPVVMVGVIPSVIVVHPSVPAKTLAEFIEFAKQRPGKLNYASAGPGSSVHLAAEMLKQAAGIYVVHIPYRGQPEALTALLAGDVDVMPLTMALARARVESGQVRALAVTTPKRSPALPQVPTVAESGFPGFEVSTWFGFLAPAGTPAPVIAKLNSEITAAMRTSEVEKRLTAVGAELTPGSPEEFRRFLEADMDRWARVIKTAGIKVD